MTTFQSFAAKEGFEIQSYSSDANAALDKTPAGLVFTRITIQVRLGVARGMRDKALTLIERAKKYCIISNALKPVVEILPEVIEA